MIEETHVYIFATPTDEGWRGPVKVGITSHLSKRLSAIQTACPSKIGIFKTYRLPSRGVARRLECGFHLVNDAHRLNGEWFDMPPAQANVSVCYGLAVALVHDPMKLNVEQVRAWLAWAGADADVPDDICEEREAA